MPSIEDIKSSMRDDVEIFRLFYDETKAIINGEAYPQDDTRGVIAAIMTGFVMEYFQAKRKAIRKAQKKAAKNAVTS